MQNNVKWHKYFIHFSCLLALHSVIWVIILKHMNFYFSDFISYNLLHLNARMLMASIFGLEFQGRNLLSCMGTPLWKLALHVESSKTRYFGWNWFRNYIVSPFFECFSFLYLGLIVFCLSWYLVWKSSHLLMLLLLYLEICLPFVKFQNY